MTLPKITTIRRGGSRLYVHPETADKVPGVTSILNMLPKEFLKFWAAKVVAETAVESMGSVVDIAMRDPQGAVDYLKRAPMRNTGRAADRGTDVHDLFEKRARGEKVARIHPDLKPFDAVYAGWEEQFQPEYLFLEETVWSDTHGYAGSFDWIAHVTDPDTGERVLAIGDWKTTRSGVHAEVALQLTAYKNADYIVRADGGRVPIPKIEAGLVVHVAEADKNDPSSPIVGQVVPARLDDELFRIFLALKEIHGYEKETKKTVLGGAIPIKTPAPKRARKAA